MHYDLSTDYKCDCNFLRYFDNSRTCTQTSCIKKGHKFKSSIHGSKELSATCSAIDSRVSVIYYSCLKSQGGRRQSHREQSNRTELLSNGLRNNADLSMQRWSDHATPNGLDHWMFYFEQNDPHTHKLLVWLRWSKRQIQTLSN